MVFHPLHLELLEEAINLLYEKHKRDALMTSEVQGLHDELRFEGIMPREEVA